MRSSCRRAWRWRRGSPACSSAAASSLLSAGLVSAKGRDGKPIVAGRRLTAFTDAEEEKVGLNEVVPFLLESRLRDLAADFVAGPDFQPHAIADGNLEIGRAHV